MKKIIDLELAREFLNEPLPEVTELHKKAVLAEKKKIKELREMYPVEISISFKWPWWDLSHQE